MTEPAKRMRSEHEQDEQDEQDKQDEQRQKQRRDSIRSFRRVLLAERGVILPPPALPCLDHDAEAGSVLPTLSDDALALVFRALLRLPSGLVGLELSEVVNETVRSVRALVMTCRRMAQVWAALAPKIRAEALARSITDVVPCKPDAHGAYSQQLRDEMLSQEQLRMAKFAHKHMACHCSGMCCKRMRRALNRDISKGAFHKAPSSPRLKPRKPTEHRVVSALTHCNVLAATTSGRHVYAYMRQRASKPNGHGMGRSTRRTLHTLVKLELRPPSDGSGGDPLFEIVASVALPNVAIECSEPLVLRAAPDGSGVAFICTQYEESGEDAEMPMIGSSAFSHLLYWAPQRATDGGASEPTRVVPPGTFGDYSAQDAWFQEGEGEGKLVVAWSSDYVHPSGHHVGSTTEHQSLANYFFATYAFDEDGERGSCSGTELVDRGSASPFGRLYTCSPTQRGDTALALIKRTNLVGSSGHRSLYLHDLEEDSDHYIMSTLMDTKAGPMSAALSPTGNSIASLHNTTKAITVEIMVRTGKHKYCAVQRVDLSTWLGLSPKDAYWGWHGDLAKTEFHCDFSPCGRFVSVIDRRPFYGEVPKNHALVIVDTAMRMHQGKTLRVHPLFSGEYQCPRSFQWTRMGIYLMPPGTDDNMSIGARGGALCLYTHNTTALE